MKDAGTFEKGTGVTATAPGEPSTLPQPVPGMPSPGEEIGNDRLGGGRKKRRYTRRRSKKSSQKKTRSKK